MFAFLNNPWEVLIVLTVIIVALIWVINRLTPPPVVPSSLDAGGEWYYVQQGQKVGPVSEHNLRQLILTGQIKATDMVWKKGMSEWAKANRVFSSIDQHMLWSSRLIATCLYWLKNTLSARVLESILAFSATAGRYSLAAAMFLGPAFLIILALKMDNVAAHILPMAADELIYLSAGTFVLLAIVLFIAEKLIAALDRLIRTTPGTVSSVAFLDCLALLSIIVGIASLVGSVILSSRFESIYPLLPGIVLFLPFQFLACFCLHPECLNIRIEDATADEEAVGLMSFSAKLTVRAVPIAFGIGEVVGAIGLFSALILLLNSGTETREALASMQSSLAVATVSGTAIVVIGLTPFVAYLLFVFNYVFIGIVRAILTMPRLLGQHPKTQGEARREPS